MSRNVKYSSAYPSGILSLHSGVRKRNETGETLVKVVADFRDKLKNYQTQYKRVGHSSLGTIGGPVVLDELASQVFEAYKQVKNAEKEHAIAVAKAPITNNVSYAYEEVNEPYMFGLRTRRKEYPVSITLTTKEEREVNAIVRDHASVATRFGLTHSGSTLGPNMAGGSIRKRMTSTRKNNSRKGRKQSRRN